MLKVKYLTLFKQKKMKKGGNFDQGCKKNPALRVMPVFSPQPLKKWFLKKKFVNSPQEESKCKNAQFLQWILKGDVVYFQKITAS